MDVLADVLREASQGNAVLTRSELHAPWALKVPAEIRVAIHVVQRGGCWLRTADMPEPLRLNEGDVVLIPGALEHTLSDKPDTPPLPLAEGLALQKLHASAGQPGEAALLCAEITFDRASGHPLADVLPDLIHIPSDAAERGEAMPAITRLLLREAGDPRVGSDIVVSRLIDALLILIVRHWLGQQQPAVTGWLGALRDTRIMRALAAIHEAPGHSWTVSNLADRASMSRAAFARRFPALVGKTPIEYVTNWRMTVATKLLRTTALSVEAVALQVGYDSSTAFSSAFRRHFAISPGRYRSQRDEGAC